MQPQVFLSLSGKDDAFAEKVFRQLPHGLCIFYRESFQNGTQLLDAMEAAVKQTSLFVLFASKELIASCWVQFEIDQARLAKIRNPNVKVLVFPLSADIAPSMLPKWMQGYWIAKAGFGPGDIARYVRRMLTEPLTGPVVGRGQLLDVTTQRLMTVVAETGETPSVIIFSGITGVGRRTSARYFAKQALSAHPDLIFGPELPLPQFADLADLYRGLRDQIEATVSLEKFERDLTLFREMSVGNQVKEVVNSLCHFANLGQAVFAITGSGLFEDRGDLKNWVPLLFTALASHVEVRLCLISNRQLREESLQSWKNVIQFSVPPLKDPDIRALMTSASSAFGLKPISASENLVRSIGGHAQIAKAAVRIISQRGEGFFDRDPRTLFSIQDEILSENLNVDFLNVVQQEILCMLSWVPQLDGVILNEVVEARHKLSRADFSAALDDLILGCLVLLAERDFMISPAIRQMFRRKYGYGQSGLLNEFSKVLQEAWTESLDAGDFRSELFDAFVFMHALEGKSLPSELRRLLLPSTLRELVNESYARGRDDFDRDALRRVTSWGAVAQDMKMDETVREEILSTVVRAHIRLDEYKDAERILKTFDDRRYRSAFFLRGFAMRLQGKYREALPLLRTALELKKWDRSTVQEIATCYQKLNMRAELAALVHEHEDVVNWSASLLYFKTTNWIAARRFADAEQTIQRLKLQPENEGRATIAEAHILIQRDHNYAIAEKLLSDLLESGIGNAVAARRWRAIAAANAKHFELARSDIEFIRGRLGKQDTAQRLDVYYALAEADYDGAERIFSQLRNSGHDDPLKARILEARAADVRTSLSEREALRAQATALRAKNQLSTEYDFD